MLHKGWFPREWKGMNMYLNSCMTESAWIDLEAWSWALQLSEISPCQFINNSFAWGAGKVFSSVLVTSYSYCVLHMVNLEGKRTNHWGALCIFLMGIGLWLLLILLFLSQELPAANSAPVYGHYSHGATRAHNWVTSAQTSWCLPEPPQWLWALQSNKEH